MVASCSKCPPNYVRPVVAVIHSGQSPSARDAAWYLGAHLALGGYAQVELAPYSAGLSACNTTPPPMDSMSTKALKEDLATQGVAIPSGATERSELEALLARARARSSGGCTVTVVRHNHVARRSAPAVSLALVDCRAQHRVVDAVAAVERCAMVIVCVEADEVRQCGEWLARQKRGHRRDALPIILINAPGTAQQTTFEACFEAEARPKPCREDKDRDLLGRTVCVSAAIGFFVSARASDGALAALSAHGKLVLERLDSEREAALSKFYDLLSTCEALPIEYLPRGHLTTTTWGALLVNGPLIAAASLGDPSDYRESLCASRRRRIVAAAAIREVRFAFAHTAANVRRGRTTNTALWKPAIDVAQSTAFPRLLEWALSLPNSFFRTISARFVLGAPFSANVPEATSMLAQLKAACERANLPTPNLDALEDALRHARVKGAPPPDSALSVVGTNENEPLVALFAGMLFIIMIAAASLLLAMLFPNSRSARTYFRSEDL